jgi:ABC-type dipeptide/oligopeptide/nickel transport system permease component
MLASCLGINLVLDLIYGFHDPRIKVGQGALHR